MRAGPAVSVADAEEQVKQQAHWITRRNGGDGAVREICNLILAAQEKDQIILGEILAS
jgi:3-deoxy-D-manno-octulosonate 8-phosphate phosphatase (KDO 8-P phosphatase)